MPPITYQALFDKRQQGKDLHSRRFGEKNDRRSRKEQEALSNLWKALDRTITRIDRGKTGLNTRPLKQLRDNIDTLFRDPAQKQEHTEKEKQEYKWDRNKPVRPLTYEHRNNIENAICSLSGLGDYLGQRVDKEFTNAYQVILDEASAEDSLTIENGIGILNDVLELDLPMEALQAGETCISPPEKQDEWDAYKKNIREGQEKRKKNLEDWEEKARSYEQAKREASKKADDLERKDIQAKDKKTIADAKKAQLRQEDQKQNPQQQAELEEQRKAQAREKALNDRQNLRTLREKSVQRYRDPNASPDMKKINMAMAAAFQEELDRMGKAGEVPMDENRVKQNMDAYYNSAEFAMAESKGSLDELAAMEPDAIRQQILRTEQEVQAAYKEGAPESWKRAGKLWQRFNETKRIQKNSRQFEQARDAMKSIYDRKKPATRAEQYVAAETVKAYVSKNINRAKSEVGRERMAISLAFLKQTMTPASFQAYCASLDAQRRAAGDTSPNRRIDPKNIGTVDEVYRETLERVHEVAVKGDGTKPDARDLAMLTALSRLKQRGGPDGGNRAVEQRDLQEEIEKVQSDRRFQDAVRDNSAEELINKAWYGSLNKIEGYAEKAPTGPVAEAQVQL